MTVMNIEIQFVQCDQCGAHAPCVFDSDHGPRVDGALAQDAAKEQGWRVNGDGADWCVECVAAEPEPDDSPPFRPKELDDFEARGFERQGHGARVPPKERRPCGHGAMDCIRCRWVDGYSATEALLR